MTEIIEKRYSFEFFKREAIERFLALEKYDYIRKELYNTDISTDEEYQKAFNSFFRVRRNEKWRKKFYKYFEKVKNNKNISFETIVKDLLLETGNIEASFSSKLLATINPNMPIWDQYILKNLDLKITGTTKNERLSSVIDLYNKIVMKEQKLLSDTNIKKTVKEFKDYFPEYDLSNIKILDYILWNLRDDE